MTGTSCSSPKSGQQQLASSLLETKTTLRTKPATLLPESRDETLFLLLVLLQLDSASRQGEGVLPPPAPHPVPYTPALSGGRGVRPLGVPVGSCAHSSSSIRSGQVPPAPELHPPSSRRLRWERNKRSWGDEEDGGHQCPGAPCERGDPVPTSSSSSGSSPEVPGPGVGHRAQVAGLNIHI